MTDLPCFLYVRVIALPAEGKLNRLYLELTTLMVMPMYGWPSTLVVRVFHGSIVFLLVRFHLCIFPLHQSSLHLPDG